MVTGEASEARAILILFFGASGGCILYGETWAPYAWKSTHHDYFIEIVLRCVFCYKSHELYMFNLHPFPLEHSLHTLQPFSSIFTQVGKPVHRKCCCFLWLWHFLLPF